MHKVVRIKFKFTQSRLNMQNVVLFYINMQNVVQHFALFLHYSMLIIYYILVQILINICYCYMNKHL